MHGRRQKKIPVYKFLSRNKARKYSRKNIFQVRFDWVKLLCKIPLNPLHTGKFDTEACQYWDKFYEMHQDKFFKDRKWLFLEFPELLPSGAKSQATNWCLGDQHVSDPQPAESSTDTETRHRQHNGPTHHHRNPDTSNDQGRVCHGAAPEKHEAAVQTTTFPGQHASFRILEVFKTHMY